jgi:hypothetical protein
VQYIFYTLAPNCKNIRLRHTHIYTRSNLCGRPVAGIYIDGNGLLSDILHMHAVVASTVPDFSFMHGEGMPLSLAFVMLLFIYGEIENCTAMMRVVWEAPWCGTKWWAPHFINQESTNLVLNLFQFVFLEDFIFAPYQNFLFCLFWLLKDGFMQVTIVEVHVASDMRAVKCT